MWIWQQNNWPNFKYNADIVLPVLSDLMHCLSSLTLLSNELDVEKKLQLELKQLLDEVQISDKKVKIENKGNKRPNEQGIFIGKF